MKLAILKFFFSLPGVVCVVCFAISLVFSQGAGNYIFTLFDNFAGSVPLLVIALSECLAVAYVYGLRRYHIADYTYVSTTLSIFLKTCTYYFSHFTNLCHVPFFFLCG